MWDLHLPGGLKGYLTSCTLTGADDLTPAHTLLALAKRYPFVEWAVLASEDRAGSGRYPTFATIRSVGALGEPARVMTAIHLCGSLVRRFVAGDPEVMALTAGFGRVQLNFNAQASPLDLITLGRQIAAFGRPVITQFNPANEAALSMLYGVAWNSRTDISNHHALFDTSGGRGALPGLWPLHASRWTVAAPPAVCGYAGGLGPDVIAAELPRIAKAAGGKPFWVDMESKLRTADDRFSFEACAAVLDQVAACMVPAAA